jgi:hypothetical protein
MLRSVSKGHNSGIRLEMYGNAVLWKGTQEEISRGFGKTLLEARFSCKLLREKASLLARFQAGVCSQSPNPSCLPPIIQPCPAITDPFLVGSGQPFRDPLIHEYMLRPCCLGFDVCLKMVGIMRV